MIVSSVGLRKVQRCRVACAVTRTAVAGGSDTFAWVLFSPQKGAPHLAFWLFWFCVCGSWLLSSSYGHLASARSGQLATVHVYNGKSHRHRKLQLMFRSPSFDHQTWRKGSLPGDWKHTGTLAIVVRHRPSKSVPFFSEIPALYSARPSQVADWRSSLRPLSDILAMWKQKSALWREGGVEPERFSLVWGFFARKKKRKLRKKCLARRGRLRWLEKLPRRALAVGESPKVAAILWIEPILQVTKGSTSWQWKLC